MDSTKKESSVLPIIGVWKDNKLDYLDIDDELIKTIESGQNWGLSILEGICSGCGEKLKVLCLVENMSPQELDKLIKNIDGLPHDLPMRISEEKIKLNDIKNFLSICDLTGKKICFQYLYSNEEVGQQCIIIVMDLYDNNDISDILRKLYYEKIKKCQDKLVSLLHDMKDKGNLNKELKNDIIEDLNTLDWLTTNFDKAYPDRSEKIIQNKCRGFYLTIKPDSTVELRRIDTEEYIDIKNMNDFLNVLKDDKYDFIYT